MRFQIPAPVNLSESGTFSLSPDGRHLVFGGSDTKGIFRLWIRSLDSLETTPIQGSETERESINFMPPVFWSPDSRVIAFFTFGGLKRMDRTGGLPRAVCEVPGVGVGGAWNTADVIIVGNTSGGLVRCPAAGGPATPATALNPSLKDAAHLFPVFLPDNRHFLYLRVSRTDPSESGLYVGDLETPADRQSTERLVETPFGGSYVPGPAGDGHVLFVRDGTLMALPFDAERRVAIGEPSTVATGVGSFRDGAFFFAAGNALVYREAVPQFQLTWLDRRGAAKGLVGEPAELGGATLSPDATRVALWRPSQLGRSSHELWLVDVVRNTSTRFATDPEGDMPAWSADGRDLYFVLGTRGASLNRKAVDGNRPAETLRRSGTSDGPLLAGGAPMDSTPDGRFLVFSVEGNRTSIDLWLQPLAAGAKAIPLIQQDFDQIDGRPSPDGRWLAYVSNESGIDEVFLSPLTRDPATGVPVVGSKVLVSSGGGMSPRWRKDGRELFYQSEWSRDGRHRGRRGGRHAHRTLSRARHPEGVERERRRPALPRRRASSSKCADVHRRRQLAVGSEALTVLRPSAEFQRPQLSFAGSVPRWWLAVTAVRHQLRPARPRRHAEGRPRRDGAGAAREAEASSRRLMFVVIGQASCTYCTGGSCAPVRSVGIGLPATTV